MPGRRVSERTRVPDIGATAPLRHQPDQRELTWTRARPPTAGAQWAVACPVAVESFPRVPVGHDLGRTHGSPGMPDLSRTWGCQRAFA